MDKFNRAVRRHHVARLKHNRNLYWGYGSGRDGVMDKKQLGKVVQYPAICSCWMCGNPRKRMRGSLCQTLTIQEQRQLIRMLDGLLDLQT